MIPSLRVSQSSEARLYTFSQETKDQLRKFRLGTSRSNDPQAVICMYVPAPDSRRTRPISDRGREQT